MDSADVRFDRVERMLGEWPDEFATSQLCTMSSNLAEDVDNILASAEDLSAILAKVEAMKGENMEQTIAANVAKWVMEQLKPMGHLYAKLSDGPKAPGVKFTDLLVERMVQLEAQIIVNRVIKDPSSNLLQTARPLEPVRTMTSMFEATAPVQNPSPMDTSTMGVEAEIIELKEHIQSIRDELIDDRVEISTVAFLSSVHARSWMYAHSVPDLSFYHFYDPISLLTVLTRTSSSIDAEIATDKNTKSGSYASKEAALYAASFALELPEIFGKETTTNQHRPAGTIENLLPYLRTRNGIPAPVTRVLRIRSPSLSPRTASGAGKIQKSN
eukprot:scaffold73962_cov36-Attheya_sp.AAC.1